MLHAGVNQRGEGTEKDRNINNELTEVTEQRLADQVRQIKWLEQCGARGNSHTSKT